MSGDDFYLTPGESQKALGVSASGLRRLAASYEQEYGELAKDPNGARIWSGLAVERLKRARALVSEGRARSVQGALRLVESGAEPSPVGLDLRGRDDSGMTLVLERLEALQREVSELRGELTGRALPEVRANAEGGARGVAGGEGGLLVRFARRIESLLRR